LFSADESASLPSLAELELDNMQLWGVPQPGHLAPFREHLQSLSLRLGGKGAVLAAFEAPWPKLRHLRLVGGNAGHTNELTDKLPSLHETLPACDILDLYETSTRAKIIEALVKSPLAHGLTGLRLHDARLSAQTLASLEQVPFTQLRHLGLGALRVKPSLAKKLADAACLKTLECLEIDARLGKKGLSKLVEALPRLSQLAIWNGAPSAEELTSEFGLEGFVEAGGTVQPRLS